MIPEEERLDQEQLYSEFDDDGYTGEPDDIIVFVSRSISDSPQQEEISD